MKRILLATCLASFPACAFANPICSMPVSAETPPAALAMQPLTLPLPVPGATPAPSRPAPAEPSAPPAVQPPRTDASTTAPPAALTTPVLRHVAASGASLEDLGVRDGLRMVIARSGAEFMVLSVAPTGEAMVAGLPADLSIAKLRQVAGPGITELGERQGLRGFVVRSGNAFQVFYATPNGEKVIPGVMWDATGRNLTREQVSDVEGAVPTVTIGDVPNAGTRTAAASPPRDGTVPAPGPVQAPASGALAVAQQATSGTVGSSTAPHLWMFADPQCGFSVSAMQRLQPLIAGGRVQVSVIPVAILDHHNAGLSTADSLAMLSRSGSEMVQAWNRGDLRNPPSPEAADRLRANTQAAKSIGLRGTPTFVWRRADGQEGRQDGLPGDLDALVASVQGG